MKKRGFLRELSVLSAVFFFVSIVGLPLSWAQPLSMGRVELKGKAVVKAGEGLVFQAPKDTEVPLMAGSMIETGEKSQALLDWTGKGTLVLPGETRSLVNEKGLHLEKGSVTTSLSPGQNVVITALDCTFSIFSPPGSAGRATIAIKGQTVEATSETAKIKGVCRHKGAFILLAGEKGTFGAAAAVAAATSLTGPALIAGGTVAGIIGVAIAASNNGGGGPASPSTP